MYIVFNFLKIFNFFHFDTNGDVTLKINGSSLTFMKSGDILVKAQRHVITERDLSFDNCPRQMVQEAIMFREMGDMAYDSYINNMELEEADGNLADNRIGSDQVG